MLWCLLYALLNQQRPHRGLALATPAGEIPDARGQPTAEIRRRDILAGVIHEYHATAA